MEDLAKEINYRKEYKRLKGVEKENEELKETIINMSKIMFKRDNDLNETIKIIARELEKISRRSK